MKGIVFTVLNKMVEEKFGMEVWDRLLSEAKPKSGGAYTTADTYEDAELFSLVAKLSEMTKISAGDLVFAFGEYMLLQLAQKYPGFFEKMDLKRFLLSIDKVIHVEVRKLYPDAGLPEFSYETPADNELVMVYRSPRKMCRLAEGLIQGASVRFNTGIKMQHPKCLHRGDDHCRIELILEVAHE